MAVPMTRPMDSHAPNAGLRRWWGTVAILILAAVFLEACFAGAMLSGYGWARAAHSLNAGFIVAAAIVGGLVSIVVLRGVPRGPRLGLVLLSLAAAGVFQTAMGVLSAKGANLLWVHVPLGVAVFGLAAWAAAVACRLGGE